MTRRADAVENLRRESWRLGRALRDSLLQDYCRRYRLATPPSPATIADELITDFLHARLYYDPLDANIFAQTELKDGIFVVTVNSQIKKMPGIIDHEGVANVAKWHEILHIHRDAALLAARRPLPFAGFSAPAALVCYRDVSGQPDAAMRRREFIAEEAGRAAAVSHRALLLSPAFQKLASMSGRVAGGQGWQLLAAAARDLGVNRSALVTQLRLEGRIHIHREGGRNLLEIQPSLGEPG
jgi:hypothetical protein